MDNMVRRALPNGKTAVHQILFGKVQEACTGFNIVSLTKQIEAAEDLFTENSPIDVAILGQFKAGKSSFINSLINRPILPVGVIPVTTVITRLQYGTRERAVVTYFTGGHDEISLEEIEEFISEARNPINEKNVEVVDIELPSLLPYAGLRLVDTPGLGSVFKYNTETSEEWLPRVGTAIVAISSDRPLSENDLSLIRELMEYTPNVVLLLTKADLLSEEQQKEVMKFFRTTLKRELGRDLSMFMYSTVSETELFKRWFDKLLFSLSLHRETESTRILEHKIKSLAKSCLGYLRIARETSVKSDVDREKLKGLILDEKVNDELIQSELFLLARESKHHTRPFIAARLEMLRADLTKKLMTELGQELRSWKGNLWQLTRRYEAWLEEQLTKELGAISKKEYTHFFGTLKKAQAAISRSVQMFRHLLDTNIEKVLGVRLAEFAWKIEITEPSRPDVAFLKTFDFHFDLLWFLIPMLIFQKVFERHFLKQIPRVVETHLSRLAYQWEVRINSAIDEAREQAYQYVRDELSTIDGLVSRTTGQTERINRLISEIEQDLKHMEGESVS
jgi:GTP-binding protein EngB required for normal cell division